MDFGYLYLYNFSDNELFAVAIRCRLHSDRVDIYIQSDSGGICNNLGNVSTCDS